MAMGNEARRLLLELKCARAAPRSPFLTRLMMGRSLWCQRCQSSLHSHRLSTVTPSARCTCGRVQQTFIQAHIMRGSLAMLAMLQRQAALSPDSSEC